MNIPYHGPMPGDDQPLPADVLVKSSRWTSRARHYPVFTPTWYRLRTVPLLLIDLAVFALIQAMSLVFPYDPRIVAIFTLTGLVGTAVLITLGPALAVWVRRRGLTGRRELGALALALALGSGAAFGAFNYVGDLVKPLLMGNRAHATAVLAIGGRASVEEADERTPAAQVKKGVQSDEEIRSKMTPLQTQALEYINRILVVSFVLAFFYTQGGWAELIAFIGQRRLIEEVRQAQVLARAQAARHEAELKLSVLAAQVEPHFLFNTLAGVRSAITTDPERAVAIVDGLVDYLRATIPHLRGEGGCSQGRLGPQLEAARAYLTVMHGRMTRLSFDIEADAGLDEAALPPLILLPLVENAVKHGIEPKIGPGRITVSARRVVEGESDVLALCVADDGVGFGGGTSGTGIGLTNIRERLDTLYGGRARLTLKALPEGGVAAHVHLPLVV